MTMKLPGPVDLESAVAEVIQQNVELGYSPTRFSQKVRGKKGNDLVRACTELITSDSAVEALEKALGKYPNLLTLEDLVVRSLHGREWGIDEETFERASASVKWFDTVLGTRRWSQ